MKKITMFCLLACSMLFAYDSSWEQTILPKPPVSEQKVTLDDISIWRDFEDFPVITRSVEPDGLLLQWDGQVDYTNANPKYGRVQLGEDLPIVRGDGNRVSLMINAATLKLASDSEFMPLIQLKNKEGYVVVQREMYPPDFMHYLYTCNDRKRPRPLDLTFEVPDSAETLNLIFECRGNAMDILITNISLGPANPKEKWDFEKVRVGIPKPDVVYLKDDAEATPDQVILSDAEVEQLLAERPMLYPHLEKNGDRVKFTVNGEEEAFAVAWPPFKKDRTYLQNNMRMGYKIFMMPVAMGPRADSVGWPFNVWIDDDTYDFAKIGEGIRHILSLVPDAQIILYLRMTLPTAWAEKHPDAIHTNEKGERAVSEWSRVNRYGGEPPTGEREFYEACNYSEEFRDGGAKALHAIGEWLNQAPEGKVVIGAYIHGGADTQWFYSYEPQFADYSAGTLKAYRKYLREKYHDNPAEIAEAWGFEVAFDEVNFPEFALRNRTYYASDPNIPHSALMSYNHTEQEAADYNEFMSVGNTRRQLAFTKAFKDGSNGRLLAGTYWPVLPNSYPLAHGDFIEMVNSPDIDFISRGGIPSAVFHGKMCVGEFDLRNLASGLDAWLDYDHPLIAKSPAEFRRYVLAHTAAELAIGAGYHLWDMHGGWHWHPTAVSALKDGQELTKALKDFPSVGENYVGIFMDEDAADQLRTVGQYYTSPSVQSLFMKYGWGWASGLERLGLPVRCYLQQDALNPDLTLPRVAIFLNPLTMTVEEGKAIRERFEKDGRVVTYMLAPGLAAPGTPQNPSEITGFKIIPDQDGTGNRVLKTCAEDPLLKGIPNGTLVGSYCVWDLMDWTTSAVSAPDSPGKVLAKYAGTDYNGMLVDRNDQRTKVWIGGPGCINREIIRNMAREAGLEPMLENDAWLFYGAGILGVGGQPCGGLHTVNLPQGIKVLECLTGHEYQIEGNKLTFTLGTGEVFGDVAVFSVAAE